MNKRTLTFFERRHPTLEFGDRKPRLPAPLRALSEVDPSLLCSALFCFGKDEFGNCLYATNKTLHEFAALHCCESTAKARFR
jgi:hypothetical protein